jgi:hypothetical protein
MQITWPIHSTLALKYREILCMYISYGSQYVYRTLLDNVPGACRGATSTGHVLS